MRRRNYGYTALRGVSYGVHVVHSEQLVGYKNVRSHYSYRINERVQLIRSSHYVAVLSQFETFAVTVKSGNLKPFVKQEYIEIVRP